VRVNVYEQGTLEVLAARTPGASGVSLDAATAIVDAGLNMGARLATWDSPVQLRFHQFVGLVVVEDLQVEVLPKVDGWATTAKAREALLRMLVTAHDLDVKSSDMAACVAQEEPVLASLARIYLLKLAEALRRGLRQEYKAHEDQLPRVRGKINWAAQLRLEITHVPGFACRFDDRSEDTPLNRVLKAALRVAERILASDGLGPLRLEVRHAMEGVTETRMTATQIAAVHLDRMSCHLAPLLTLAKLLLGQANPDFGEVQAQRNKTFAFIWDMNVLFETYVAKVAKATLEPDGVTVFAQAEAGLYLGVYADSGKGAFALRPDLVLHGGGVGTIILDTKWKRLEPNTPNGGVSPADVYQVNAYAQRFEADSVVLAYPHAYDGKAPGERARFLVSRPARSPLEVVIFTIDLSDLDRVPDQLSELVAAKVV